MKSIYCGLFCLFVVLYLPQTYMISIHLGSQIAKTPSRVGLALLVYSYFVRRTTYKSSAASLHIYNHL